MRTEPESRRGRFPAARPRAARRLIAGVVLTTGLLLGACAVKFGPGSEDSPDQSPTPRDRNQLYQQEQQRMEYQRQFDRVGPSDR